MFGSFGGFGAEFGIEIFLFEFAAPAFDLKFVEDLADDSAEEAFEVGELDFLQGTDGGFLVAFEEGHGLLVSAAVEGPVRADRPTGQFRG